MNDTIIFSGILYVIGLLFLFFGKFKNPTYDIIGFALTMIGYIILLSLLLLIKLS